jgi:hypothetical protein
MNLLIFYKLLKKLQFLPLIYPPELEVKETTDTASSASFLDLYLVFDDSGQISTKIYDMYISQLIRYARDSSNYSDFLKRHLELLIDKTSSIYLYVKLKALTSWIFLYFTSFWRNSDSYEYKNKSARRGAQFVPIGMPN